MARRLAARMRTATLPVSDPMPSMITRRMGVESIDRKRQRQGHAAPGRDTTSGNGLRRIVRRGHPQPLYYLDHNQSAGEAMLQCVEESFDPLQGRDPLPQLDECLLCLAQFPQPGGSNLEIFLGSPTAFGSGF